MREATLRLALEDASVRPLINPRQSAPIQYLGSPLNCADAHFNGGAQATAPGLPAPEALLADGSHLSGRFGAGFVCLMFAAAEPVQGLAPLIERGIRPLWLSPASGQAWQRYGMGQGNGEALFLVRPDGYLMGRWRGLDAQQVTRAFDLSGIAPSRDASSSSGAVP